MCIRDRYIGEERKIDEDTVEAIKRITRPASQRIIQAAFEYAAAHQRKKVTCVHKANILKQSDGLFLRIFREIAAQYPQIEATDLIDVYKRQIRNWRKARWPRESAISSTWDAAY